MSRSLLLVVPLVFVVVVGGILVYALLPPPEPPAPAAVVAPTGAVPAGEPVPRAVAPRPRAGRVLSLGEAVKELDLIRPSRQKLADDFRLPMPGGKTFRLSEHQGKVVLVNFWATWCPPCREEMPAMERLWRQHRDAPFVLVAVSVDTDPAVVTPFVGAHGLSFPVALDPRMEAANSYGVRALPSSFVVDRTGALVALALGPRVWDNDAAHSLVEALSR